jgi:hypothetical protein
VAAEQHLGEEVVHHVVGGVVVHPDLLEDHGPLRVDVVLGELGEAQHVGQDVDRQLEVAVERPGVEAGVLLGGEGVGLAADRVHQLGDVPGRAALGALEQHVLEEVRGAREAWGLVA